MAKVEMIAPSFLKPTPNRIQPTPSQKKAIKDFTARQNSGNYAVNSSIEQLVTKINSATSYTDIPDKVMFSYINLIERNLDFKETFDLVNFTLRLAASRFNEKPKEIIFSGFAGAVIENTDYKNLISAGFTGCSLSPMMYGIEAAEESVHCIKKDPYYWSPVVVPNSRATVAKSMPLEITLTFRQEQIFKMVCTGMTNHQIARRLELSESTVKMHIGILLKKYRAQHRSQLIVLDNRPRL
jgi:DNA-binding CsgD family transcriptional regulator